MCQLKRLHRPYRPRLKSQSYPYLSRLQPEFRPSLRQSQARLRRARWSIPYAVSAAPIASAELGTIRGVTIVAATAGRWRGKVRRPLRNYSVTLPSPRQSKKIAVAVTSQALSTGSLSFFQSRSWSRFVLREADNGRVNHPIRRPRSRSWRRTGPVLVLLFYCCAPFFTTRAVGTLCAGKTKTQRRGKDHHLLAGSARTLLGPICSKENSGSAFGMAQKGRELVGRCAPRLSVAGAPDLTSALGNEWQTNISKARDNQSE